MRSTRAAPEPSAPRRRDEAGEAAGAHRRAHRRARAGGRRPSPTPSCARRPTSSASATGDGESLDDLLPEAFAVVREAAVRTLGQRHFTVQLMGGAALHLGNIAEMKTGEGKTLTSVLPAYLNAIVRRRRARGHGQRLPGQARRGEHGPDPPLPRPDRRRDPLRDAARRSAARSTPPTSPTARTTSSASTTCATTWRGTWPTWCSAGTTSPSSTRPTRSSSTRRARR